MQFLKHFNKFYRHEYISKGLVARLPTLFGVTDKEFSSFFGFSNVWIVRARVAFKGSAEKSQEPVTENIDRKINDGLHELFLGENKSLLYKDNISVFEVMDFFISKYLEIAPLPENLKKITESSQIAGALDGLLGTKKYSDILYFLSDLVEQMKSNQDYYNCKTIYDAMVSENVSIDDFLKYQSGEPLNAVYEKYFNLLKGSKLTKEQFEEYYIDQNKLKNSKASQLELDEIASLLRAKGVDSKKVDQFFNILKQE